MTMLQAQDLMTREVFTVPPETPVAAIARLLSGQGISALPVLGSEGQVLGIVTEADLIRRLAGEEAPRPGLLRQLFSDKDRMAARYAAVHGATAAEVMTQAVISVTPETPVSAIALLMEEKQIRRVLVLREGRLVGLVSRADLLRALVAPPENASQADSDEGIRRAILARMKREPWADSFYVMVEVTDGVVRFYGFSPSPAVQRGLHVLAGEVPGVQSVEDHSQPLPPYLFGA